MNDVEILLKVLSMLQGMLVHEAHEGEGTPEELGVTGNGVKKAFTNVVAPFQDFKVTKSWAADGTIYQEGWISTNHRDRQRDITEPEAFKPVLKSYFERNAPVTNTHDTTALPIGHLQRGALLRDGVVFAEEVHPLDPADFTSLPTTGNGFFARVAINDPVAGHAVQKGNLGGASFIAYAAKSEPLSGGGKRYLEFSELMETTIAAFPINPSAVLRVAKAYGYSPEKETLNMTPEELKAMIAQAIADTKAAEAPVQKAEPAALKIEDISAVLTTALQAQNAAFDAKLETVQKSFTEYSRQGVGRLGQVAPTGNEREDDPASYILKKAASGEELSFEDKDLIAELTLFQLKDGMQDR